MVEESEFEHSWVMVDSDEKLEQAAEALAEGTGPVGVDAERASGFRYFPSAYLVQASRRGAGTFIFDPTSIDSFAPVAEALGGEEWILHAASQDLACLAELGLTPERIFDTELAARLLGYERVGLGAVVEHLLGVRLEKAHSASDWSTRPLPDDWLNYAALDVTLLPDLRDRIADELIETGKANIAEQEFNAVLERPQKPPLEEPWRRVSGLHKLRSPQKLAVARELWFARDALARDIDVAPGRLIPDSSIVLAAEMLPRSANELARNRDFRGRASRTELPRWWQAILRGKTSENLPSLRGASQGNGLPHHRTWAKRNPEADARLKGVRELLAHEAERLEIPQENLLAPDVVRRIAWEPPVSLTPSAISAELERLGARPWQAEATQQLFTQAFVDID